MEIRFFLFVNDQQLGPFTLDELKKKHITSETYVWHEGIDDWVQASQVEELKSLFNTSPPTFKKSTNDQKMSPQPEMIFGIKKARVYLLIGSIFLLCVFLYFRSKNERLANLVIDKTTQVEQLTNQNQSQQEMIEKLQSELTENIENNRKLFDSEVRDNIESKRQTILIQLNEANANLKQAQDELSHAESFQLFRMEWERDEDIRNAMDNVNKWRIRIAQLEQSLNSLEKTGY